MTCLLWLTKSFLVKKIDKDAFLFKLDFKKAINSLNWNFLDSIMNQLDFPPLVISVIKGNRHRGIHCPLFCCIIVMEAITMVITMVCDLSILHGICNPNRSLSISYIFYVDGKLFIGELSQIHHLNLVKILCCFNICNEPNFLFRHRCYFLLCSFVKLSIYLG